MVWISFVCILTIWQLTKRVSCMESTAAGETVVLENGMINGVDSEINRTENPFTKTASTNRYKMISTTRGNKRTRSRRKKKQGKVQKPQFRLLEPPDSCMNWSPNFNVTADHTLRRLDVDYCQSELLPVPDTYTCVTNTEITLCLVIHSPSCSHVFSNLTTGNYTILVKPLCTSCFDVEVYSTECITAIYTKYISLEATTEENSSAEEKQSYSPYLKVIIPASCAGVAMVIILIIIYLMTKYRSCRKSPLCGNHNADINQTLLNFPGQPATDSQAITERLRNPQLFSQEQETSFASMENYRETEAMLSNSNRLTKKQALLYLPLKADPSQSMKTSFSDIPSCRTLSISSIDNCVTCPTEQDSQSSCIVNDHQETLQAYFDMHTGITKGPANMLSVPETVDIPIHLIFTDSDS